MDKTTVYRIQDNDGRGPWKPGFSHKWVIDRPDHDNLLPWYFEMGPVHEQIRPGFFWGTGCLNIHQLKRWFTKKEYKKLKRLGYMAVMFDVDRLVGKSNIQCVFERMEPLNQNIRVFKLY